MRLTSKSHISDSELSQSRGRDLPLLEFGLSGKLIASVPILVALLSAIAYIATLAPDLSWSKYSSDGGELITAAMTLGIAHPPGYPTYVLLGKLFSFLPVGATVAYRFNLFSALSMALAVGFLTATISRSFEMTTTDKVKKALTAGSLGLVFAFSPLVWNSAEVAEVYPLNLAMIALLLFLLKQMRRPLLIGIIWGLSITTHLTSLLLAPLVLGLVPANKRTRLLPGVLIGLLPFFLLPLFPLADSPVIWGNPTSVSGWWWLVSARLYHPNILPLDQLLNAAGGNLLFFSLILVVLIAILVVFRRKKLLGGIPRRSHESVLMVTAGFYLLFASQYRTSDALVLVLPAILLLTLALSRLAAQLGPGLIVLPILLLSLNFTLGQRANGSTPRLHGQSVLANTPRGAILLSQGEQITFTLWYLQQVEILREDLAIIDTDLFQFSWYRDSLEKQYPFIWMVGDDNLEQFTRLNQNERTVCLIDSTSTVHPKCFES